MGNGSVVHDCYWIFRHNYYQPHYLLKTCCVFSYQLSVGSPGLWPCVVPQLRLLHWTGLLGLVSAKTQPCSIDYLSWKKLPSGWLAWTIVWPLSRGKISWTPTMPKPQLLFFDVFCVALPSTDWMDGWGNADQGVFPAGWANEEILVAVKFFIPFNIMLQANLCISNTLLCPGHPLMLPQPLLHLKEQTWPDRAIETLPGERRPELQNKSPSLQLTLLDFYPFQLPSYTVCNLPSAPSRCLQRYWHLHCQAEGLACPLLPERQDTSGGLSWAQA